MTSKPTEEMLDALEPCPFCEAEARVVDAGHGNAYVKCLGCGACSDDRSRYRAVAAWNRRATLTKSSPVEAVAVKDELKLLRRIAFEIRCAAGPANDEGVIEKWATGSLHEAYKDAVAAERFLK
jgi:Restriction alleviation protein Lar